MLLVLHDAAVVNIAINRDDTVALGEQFEDSICSGFDPAGVVGGHPVTLIEGNVLPFVSSPDRVKTVKPGHRDDTGGIGADDLLKPGILFFSQQSASRVGPIISVLNVSPAPFLPDIGVLRGSPEAGIKHEKGEVAVRHLPGSPLLGVLVRVNFFGSSDEVMHDLKVATDVGRILA